MSDFQPGDRVYQHKDGLEGPRFVVVDMATAANDERIALCQVVGVRHVDVSYDANGEMARALRPTVDAVANGEIVEIRATALSLSED